MIGFGWEKNFTLLKIKFCFTYSEHVTSNFIKFIFKPWFFFEQAKWSVVENVFEHRKGSGLGS